MKNNNSLLEYGPEIERNYLTAGLDYYKPTMSQLAYEQEPNAEATFTFKNRGEQRLLDYVDIETLADRFNCFRENGFNEQELAYLGNLINSDGQPVFLTSYLQHLAESKLPEVKIEIMDDDIAIQVTGELDMATFWETVIMSELNEQYFEGYMSAHDLDVMDIYDEGDRRLSEKIAVLQNNPDIKIADFGTRRHFSHRWQRYVLERLAKECPQNLLGTSNVALAQALGMKPIGTFAHEMPMTYAGLAEARGEDVRQSHQRFLNDWYARYGEDLSTALTDTFTTDFFFDDFTTEQAEKWHGLRHDSGDAVKFAQKAICFYESKGIDPKTKTIVFSDGLDIDEIVKLHGLFHDKVNVVFGWGTTLTSDMGIKPLNIVMKVTHVRDTTTDQEANTVKISDNEGKYTGPAEKVDEYKQIFGKLALVA